jgi:AraC-like DNA-binding protein
MFLKSYQPSIPLLPYIVDYKIFHNIGYNTLIQGDTFIPAIGSALIFHFGDLSDVIIANKTSQLPKVLFVGQQTKPATIVPGKQFDILVVQFKPTGIFRLFGFPSYIFAENSYIDAHLLYNKDISSLTEAIGNEKDMFDRIKQIDFFLLQKLKNIQINLSDSLMETAVNHIILDKGCLTISALCKRISVDERTLRRNFFTQVAISAKSFSRLVRINSIIRELQTHPADLLNITWKYNYYDQSHFIKDFKEIVGETPSQFLQRKLSHAKTVSEIVMRETIHNL